MVYISIFSQILKLSDPCVPSSTLTVWHELLLKNSLFCNIYIHLTLSLSLSTQATDDDGAGQSSVVSVQVSVRDSNDNPPVFLTPVYRASIDEDATKFEPELQV